MNYMITCPKCNHTEELDEDVARGAEFMSDTEVEQYRRGYCRNCCAEIYYSVMYDLDDCDGEVDEGDVYVDDFEEEEFFD